jgi:hypothetical protein
VKRESYLPRAVVMRKKHGNPVPLRFGRKDIVRGTRSLSE